MLATIPGSAAVIYDAVDEFSNSTNSETSTWSYRSSGDAVRDGNYSRLTVHSDQGLWSPATSQWRDAAGSYPGVAVNRSGGEADWVGNASGFSWPDQTIWMHPPESSGFVILSWLSPQAGVVTVNFSLRDIDPNGGDGVVWFLDLNDAAGQLAGGTISNGAAIGSQSVSNVAVDAGDRIHLLVNRRTGYTFDSTAVTAEVIWVPEPGSVVLGLLGSLALLRRRVVRDGCLSRTRGAD